MCLYLLSSYISDFIADTLTFRRLFPSAMGRLEHQLEQYCNVQLC